MPISSICMYVYIYICTYVRTYVCMHVCIHSCDNFIHTLYTVYTVQHHWLEVHAIPTIPWFHNMSSRKASKLWFRNLAESKCLGFFTSRRLSHHSGRGLVKVNPSFLDQVDQPINFRPISISCSIKGDAHQGSIEPFRSLVCEVDGSQLEIEPEEWETMGNPYSQKTIPFTNHWQGIYHGIPSKPQRGMVCYGINGLPL